MKNTSLSETFVLLCGAGAVKTAGVVLLEMTFLWGKESSITMQETFKETPKEFWVRYFGKEPDEPKWPWVDEFFASL